MTVKTAIIIRLQSRAAAVLRANSKFLMAAGEGFEPSLTDPESLNARRRRRSGSVISRRVARNARALYERGSR